jgi:hypothetical protein
MKFKHSQKKIERKSTVKFNFHISPIDYNVSSKVALILLECWYLRSFELRKISKGKNVTKCSESDLLRYLDLKSV